MRGSVVIDCFPASVSKYADDYAIVAIDVIRATTSAMTAVVAGRRCFPAATLEHAYRLHQKLGTVLLAGELNGDVPDGFDLNNSPAQFAQLDRNPVPIVLLSTSGTQLMCLAAAHEAAYIASLRNYQAVARAISGRHKRVAVIGAGSRNEFREEDQLCCAWIAASLIDSGYVPENKSTEKVVKRWEGASPQAFLISNSVNYLRRTGQLADLDFILSHIGDVSSAFVMSRGEVIAEEEAGAAESHQYGEVAA